MTRRAGRLLAAIGLAVAGHGCDKSTPATTPSLAVDCGASPAAGTAPLTVAFSLNVAGAQGAFTVAVNYGDGTQGSDPNSPHVYPSAGTYAASLTVSTPTQSARCSALVTVAAATPAPTPAAVNQPPHADFHTNPAASGTSLTGKAPFTVNFNMCQTEDPDGDRLLFKMDLDGNGSFEHIGSTGADCRLPQTYAAGTYAPTICVTDVNCPSWPLCSTYPPNHPYQCRTYSVVVSP
ncbi:MAG: PKD domain-containing protein [Betaproteobacteria bacterium]